MGLIDTAIPWVTLAIMLVGLFSLLVPILPGLVIMWLAALGFGFVRGFDTPGIVFIILVTILTIAGSLLDNVLMGIGARKGGASWLSILVALIAGLIGTLIFPPFGGFIAAPLTVLLLEYIRLRSWQKAWAPLSSRRKKDSWTG